MGLAGTSQLLGQGALTKRYLEHTVQLLLLFLLDCKLHHHTNQDVSLGLHLQGQGSQKRHLGISKQVGLAGTSQLLGQGAPIQRCLEHTDQLLNLLCLLD